MISFRSRLSWFNPFQPQNALLLLWLFLLVFPKGGFKLGGVPITWGYLLLSLSTLFSALRFSFTCSLRRTQLLFFLLPFQLILLLTLVLHGIGHPGFAFSYILSFFFLPWAFFILLSPHIESMNLEFFLNLFRKGVFFIAAYGIFLFFYKLLTGKFIEIPFLTTNFHDLGELDFKCNNRGALFKLISTYNNGNIYGICLLMLLPLYSLIEKTRWKIFLVQSSLVLTLSRTAWLGLIFSELLTGLFIKKDKPLFFFKLMGGLLLFFFIFWLYFQFNPLFFSQQILTLGPRSEQLEITSADLHFLPTAPLGGMQEIVYSGMLFDFGICGLIAYLFCMAGPLFFSLLFPPFPPIKKALLCGLMNYLFISCSDGALLFIPVLAFYWFLTALALRKDLGVESVTA